MGRNKNDFRRDIIINRFPAIKDPKEWVPMTEALEAKEKALKSEE
jgi:hypothetical protein